jgi:hypothetical protein
MKNLFLFFMILHSVQLNAQKIKSGHSAKPNHVKKVSNTKTVLKPLEKSLPAPKPKVITREEQISLALKSTALQLYNQQFFNDAFGYYNNNNVCMGMDSIYIHPFSDTNSIYVIDCINQNGITNFKFYMKIDTLIKKVTYVDIKNYGMYYLGLPKPELREKNVCSFKWYYTAGNLDSIAQVNESMQPSYMFRFKNDSTCKRLEKYQVDNNRLWLKVWLNNNNDWADSLERFTYSSFDPYNPISRGKNYFLFDTVFKKIKSVNVVTKDEVTYKKVNYTNTFFDYDETGKTIAKRIYNRIGRSWGIEFSVSLIHFMYDGKNMLTKQTYNGFGATTENPYPVEIPEKTIPTVTTYTYNENGALMQSIEFYEDICITKRDVTDFTLTEQNYLREQKKVPSIKTRCRY